MPNPANPQSLNRYTYAANNPVRYTDPTGHVYISGITPEYGSTVGCLTPCEIVFAPPDALEVTWNAIGKGVEALVSAVFEPADWAITANYWRQGDFQATDLLGLLPLIPAGAGRYVDDAAGFFRQLPLPGLERAVNNEVVQAAIRNADSRVVQYGLQGTYAAAEAAARNGDIILPGLFRYGDNMPDIPGYQRHHLWPEGLGGPADGWTVYVQFDPNYHTGYEGIHGWIDFQLMQRTGLDLNGMREWARANPDQLLPMLREIYLDLGIDFPY